MSSKRCQTKSGIKIHHLYFYIENLVLWASGSESLRLGEPGQSYPALPEETP